MQFQNSEKTDSYNLAVKKTVNISVQIVINDLHFFP